MRWGGSILLRKSPCDLEVYNDISSDVVRFFRVLREQPEDLARAVALTPFSAEEFAASSESTSDDLEHARRFIVQSAQGIGGHRGRVGSRRTGWRRCVAPGLIAHGSRNTAAEWHQDTLLEALLDAAERLRGVMIEHGDWRECAERQRHPSTLLYLDPPYVSSTRSYGREYSVEWSEDDHRAMLAYALEWPGPCAISGYACDLYDSALEGWQRYTRQQMTNGTTFRTEVLWVNRPHSQTSLF
jgi:DNA adenine methylase